MSRDWAGRPRMPEQAPAWLSPEEQHAWRSFIRLHQKLSARLARDLQAHSKLSGADYEILVALTDTPHGRQRFQDLAKTVEWEQSRLSHQIARMTKRGVLRRRPVHPRDHGRQDPGRNQRTHRAGHGRQLPERFAVLQEPSSRLGTARPDKAPQARVFVMGGPGAGFRGNPDDLNAEKSYRAFRAHLNTVAANEALVLAGTDRLPARPTSA